ncbi:MAG TPA: DedA family protein/thiosulfate sulfurtransferase GlpE [Steroidobacteraceae bacterium]|nr:DedA family protein/thiosulfate sulfurtransferase GlpE [Steroidobacteraceae bacterium]
MLIDYRILVITANVMANQLGLPVPVLPTLIVGGALAAQGAISPTQLFVGAVLSCLLADSVWFLAGRIYGNGVMKLLCRISLTPDSCVSETQSRFERWGSNALIVAKFVPGLSLIAPPLAGATQMGWLRFLLYSALGSSAWIGAALLGGMLFRRQIEALMPRIADFGLAAVSVFCVLLVVYIAYKWWERMRFYSVLRMAQIEVGDLHKLMGTPPPPLVIDVRSATAVQLEPRCIPGARHIPLTDVQRHLRDLPRDRDIISYCTCPNEASAAQVAKILIDNGFKKVRPLHGGLDAWVAAGYTVDTMPVSATNAAGSVLRGSVIS